MGSDVRDPTAPIARAGASLYETDEHAWLGQQIDTLHDGPLEGLDREHLAQYLTEMTIRDQRELRSRLTVLLLHMLKCRFQGALVGPSWIGTIEEQQEQIRDICEDVPSLGAKANGFLPLAYERAVRRAARETGLSAGVFPPACPWTIAQALAFVPRAAGEIGE